MIRRRAHLLGMQQQRIDTEADAQLLEPVAQKVLRGFVLRLLGCVCVCDCVRALVCACLHECECVCVHAHVCGCVCARARPVQAYFWVYFWCTLVHYYMGFRV